MCRCEYLDAEGSTWCGCKLDPNTTTSIFQEIRNHTWITQKLHYNCITSSLVTLYKYLFVHGFVRFTHGFIQILTKFYCLGSTYTLSCMVFSNHIAYWPREIVTLSSDSIAYCKSSNKSLLNYTETEMSSFWWNFHHWLHWKLSKWQLPVQPVMKISSKWRHFRFSVKINKAYNDVTWY